MSADREQQTCGPFWVARCEIQGLVDAGRVGCDADFGDGEVV